MFKINLNDSILYFGLYVQLNHTRRISPQLEHFLLPQWIF
nr:MAG TPA_asm: hypothetical protein [Caudoviricetes sp.]